MIKSIGEYNNREKVSNINNKPWFVMMVGLPASGKSTIARSYKDYIIHSSDALREELFGDINDNNHNDQLFKELHKRIKNDLANSKDVVYDACNISYKRRMQFLKEIERYDVHKICVLVATSYEDCLSRNENREKKVPPEVITRMYKNIYIPQYYEGWDHIDLFLNSKDIDIHELFNGSEGLNSINQENIYHTLTIGRHCTRCFELCLEAIQKHSINDLDLCMAAMYHDIGKKFTKAFMNGKGEVTENATYYQHHLVSAYDSLLVGSWRGTKSILKVANYIQWHMQPFFLLTEKSIKNFVNMVGQEFWDNILILHEADKAAK
jgi:predicted kinase